MLGYSFYFYVLEMKDWLFFLFIFLCLFWMEICFKIFIFLLVIFYEFNNLLFLSFILSLGDKMLVIGLDFVGYIFMDNS